MGRSGRFPYTPKTVSPRSRLFFERGLPILILGVAVVCVPVQILRPSGLPRMRALEGELRDLQMENADLSRDIHRLRKEVRELKDDPGAVEKIARDQLGLVRSSELVFVFGKPAPPQAVR